MGAGLGEKSAGSSSSGSTTYMKVLALVTNAFGGYGGIAQFNRDFCYALSLSKHVREVIIVPRQVESETICLPPKLRQIAPKKGRLSYSLECIRAALRFGPFDLIFCGHLYHVVLAAGLGRLLGVPVWLQTHGIDAWDRPSPLLRNAAERSALVTAVSRYTRGRVLQWANINPTRVRVLPNTARSLFTPGPQCEAALAKHSLVGKKIVLTVSRIDKSDTYKGHVTVIEALPAIRKAEPAATYVIVGDGDGRPDLEAEVARRRLGDQVRFLGRLSDEELLALYRSASAFVMPSTKEGFGIAFVEAAACGLPVIGGNRDGSVDALAEGKIGRLIDPLSTQEIIAAVIPALNERSTSRQNEVHRFAFQNFANYVDALVEDFAA
jgi:phosphatidylinositol alpha-1,6-mannosyltransferase